MQKIDQQHIETIAQTSDAWAAWDNTPNGRERVWCKVCRDEGKAWLTPEPCEHVLKAEPNVTITKETALNTLRTLMSEAPSTYRKPAQQPAIEEPPKYDI